MLTRFCVHVILGEKEWRVFNNQGQFHARFSRRSEILGLLGFIGLCQGVGIASSGITISNVHHWYLTLTPPPLNPPNWVFAPVWAALYLTMAIAAWMIWRQADLPRRHRSALLAWGWQLGLNAIWAPIFFGLHQILLALVVVVAMSGAIAWTISRFAALHRGAALLMIPYLAWAGFASYLNAGFWWLNH